MARNDFFGEMMEKGQGVVSDTAKAAKNQAADFGKSAASQITGSYSKPQGEQVIQGSSEQAVQAQSQIQQPEPADGQLDSNKQFISELYGVHEGKQLPDKQQIQKQKEVQKAADEKKMKELRDKLHQETYYEPLTTPEQEEQGVREKNEEEEEQKKQLEMTELEEQKKKELPIAVSQAQTKAERGRLAG